MTGFGLPCEPPLTEFEQPWPDFPARPRGRILIPGARGLPALPITVTAEGPIRGQSEILLKGIQEVLRTVIDQPRLAGIVQPHQGDSDASPDGERSPAFVGWEGTAAGGISQDFETRKGQKYRVTFWMAGDTNGGPSEKKLRVNAAGKSAEFAFDTTGKDRKEMGWVKQSWEFTAEADRTTLVFSSLTEGMYGPALDNVSVVEVNE